MALSIAKEERVRLVYDSTADAASIYLLDTIQDGGTARSHVCDVEMTGCSITLDFDSEDKLVGIEVLGATKLLPSSLLSDEGAGAGFDQLS
jgi:uncharacterized protein YuzE